MSNMVQQTPENKVIITVPPKRYIDTSTNFALDFGETAPVIPMGSNDRVYEPGVRHALMLNGNVVGGGPQPWDVGDRWITNIDAGLAAQAARQPDLPPIV